MPSITRLQTQTARTILETESALTARYQTTIPDAVRKVFGLQKHDRVVYRLSDSGEVFLAKAGASSDPYAVFRRMLESGSPPDDFNELLKAVGTGK